MSDWNNNRVLIFDTPLRTDEGASVVLGQADFYHRSTNRGGVPASNTLNQPLGLAKDPSGNLYVADFGNCRILQFRPPFVSGMNASLSIQDRNFTPEGCRSDFPPEARDLIVPAAMAFDGDGDLWVADGRGSRVVEFKPPFSSAMEPTLVLGKVRPSLSSHAPCQNIDNNLSAKTLCGLGGIAFDSKGNLWVADFWDNRVLEFVPPFTSGMAARLELGQPPEAAFTSKLQISSQCERPSDHDDALSTETKSVCPEGTRWTSAGSLENPRSPAFDADGNLWVMDSGDNRILKFVPPFMNGMEASAVIGQDDFTHRNTAGHLPGLTSKLTYSNDIAFDNNGNLLVVDGLGNRVLMFFTPFRNGMSASIVLGESNPSEPSLSQVSKYQGNKGFAGNTLNYPMNVLVF